MGALEIKVSDISNVDEVTLVVLMLEAAADGSVRKAAVAPVEYA